MQWFERPCDLVLGEATPEGSSGLCSRGECEGGFGVVAATQE